MVTLEILMIFAITWNISSFGFHCRPNNFVISVDENSTVRSFFDNRKVKCFHELF